MRKNTSFRLESQIRSLISDNGGASFIEGCVLLVRLAHLSDMARRISLEFDSLGFPPIKTIQLDETLRITRGAKENLLRIRPSAERVEIESLITEVGDIPADIPLDYRGAIEALLQKFGEVGDLNI